MSDNETDNEVDSADATADRRALLTKGGVAAAVAAVAGLGLSRSAQAANGDTMYVGFTHEGTNTTRLEGGSTLRVFNGGSDGGASVYGTQDGSNVQGLYGVRGSHSGTSGIGVYGTATNSSGRGVQGVSNSTSGVGVYGLHSSATAPGTGIIGQSNSGVGVIGRGSTVDVDASQSGRVRMSSVGQSGSPTATGSTGTIARDAGGNLWYCYATNQWQILAGPDVPEPETPTTPETPEPVVGTFTPIDPVRVFDSRQDVYPGSGLLAPNEERTLSVSDGRDLTGVVTTPGAVPSGATAIAYNVTVTGTTGPNFVSVVPGDAAGYTTSSINWSGPDQSVANGSIVRIDGSRQVKVFGGDQPGSAHVILDVTGYFT